MEMIITIVIFHAFQLWLYRSYTKDYDLDKKNPTQFESIMFWPQILGIMDFPYKHKDN